MSEEGQVSAGQVSAGLPRTCGRQSYGDPASPSMSCKLLEKKRAKSEEKWLSGYKGRPKQRTNETVISRKV